MIENKIIENKPTENFYFGSVDEIDFYFYDYKKYCEEIFEIEEDVRKQKYSKVPNQLRNLFESIIDGLLKYNNIPIDENGEPYTQNSKFNNLKTTLSINWNIFNTLKAIKIVCDKGSHSNEIKFDDFEIISLLKHFHIILVFFLKIKNKNSNLKYNFKNCYTFNNDYEFCKIISDSEYDNNKQTSNNLDISVKEIKVLDFIFKSNRSFIIPIYQRGYSWNEENIIDLFNDIKDRLIDNTSHYFGVIAGKLEEFNSKDKINKIKIIDGQQRLTTSLLIIMGCYYFLKEKNYKFLDKLFDEIFLCLGSKENFKDLFVNPSSGSSAENDIFKEILRFNWIRKKDSKSIYEKNLCKIIESIEEYVGNELNKVEDILNCFLNNFTFALVDFNKETITVKKELEIFENLNSKGKSLSISDLVKNYIFNLCENDALIENGKVENYFSSKLNAELNLHDRKTDIGILLSDFYSYLIYYFKGEETKKNSTNELSSNNALLRDFKKFVVEEIFLIIGVIPSNKGISFDDYKKFIDVLNCFLVKGFITIKYNIKTRDFYLHDFISSFDRKKISLLYPLSFLISEKFKNFDDFKKNDKINLFKSYKIFVKMIIAHSMIIGQGDSSIKRNIFKVINKIRDNNFSSTFDLYNIIKKEVNINLFFKKENFIEEQIKDLIIYNKSESTNKLLLLLISYHLLDGNDPENIHTKITLEHIIPQKLNYSWIQDIRKWNDDMHDKTNKEIEEESNKYIRQLGNYLLVQSDLNSKLNNKSFSEKINILNNQNFTQNLLRNIQKDIDVLNKTSWSFENISKRSEFLYRIAYEIFFDR